MIESSLPLRCRLSHPASIVGSLQRPPSEMAFEIARVHGIIASHMSEPEEGLPFPAFLQQQGAPSHFTPPHSGHLSYLSEPDDGATFPALFQSQRGTGLYTPPHSGHLSMLPAATAGVPTYTPPHSGNLSTYSPMQLFARSGQPTPPHSSNSLAGGSPYTPPHSGLLLDHSPTGFPSPTAAFPSPRTWHASHRNSPVLSLAPSDESSEDEPSDSQPDRGAEIAEWAAQSCMNDDDQGGGGAATGGAANAGLRLAHRPAAHSRSLVGHGLDPLSLVSTSAAVAVSGSSTVSGGVGGGRWSPVCSAGVSPTSVLSKANTAAWDLLFEAAGEVQRMAREEALPPTSQTLQRAAIGRRLMRCNSLPSPKDKPQAQWVDEPAVASGRAAIAAGPAAPKKSFHRSFSSSKDREIAAHAAVLATSQHYTHSSQQRRRSDGGPAVPAGLSGSSTPPTKYLGRNLSGKAREGATTSGDNLHAVVLGNPGPPKEAAAGTGVFLPRAAATQQPPAEQAGPQGGSKKSQHRPTTVLLPARLVQALGLDVDDDNNVVLHNRAGGAAQGRIQVVPAQQQRAKAGGADDNCIKGSGGREGGGHRRTGSAGSSSAAPRGPRTARHMRTPSGSNSQNTTAGGASGELPVDWAY